MRRIDSIKNEQVKAWKKLKTRKGREKANKFLIEGYHLVEEAIKAGIQIETVMLTEEANIPTFLELKKSELIYVSDGIIKELADTETPQGIIAVCELPRIDLEAKSVTKGKFIFIDRVQDPGNIGTMIRTADSAGMTAVVLGEGCVDHFNSKVLRSSQGSIFHIPVMKGQLEEWIEHFKKSDIPIYGTALENASPYKAIEPQTNFALIMGNEGEGVSQKLLTMTNENIYIPIKGQAESLNVAVATGILLYYLSGN